MPAGRQRIRRLTDSSGGTPSTTDTVVAVPAAYAQATFQAIIATIVFKLNEVVDTRQNDAR